LTLQESCGQWNIGAEGTGFLRAKNSGVIKRNRSDAHKPARSENSAWGRKIEKVKWKQRFLEGKAAYTASFADRAIANETIAMTT